MSAETKAETTAEQVAQWHRIDEADLPAEGRVVVDGRSVAVSRCAGRLGALENRCPHQGGPLGEGSIEKGWLRCPWHGYDYQPDTGVPPEGFSDGVPPYDVEERADGCYVALPELPPPPRTVADVVVETLVSWGVTTYFGMVGHSNLGFAEALRRRRSEVRSPTSASATRAPPPSPPAPSASSPDDPLPASPSPAPGPPTCSPACTTPSWTGHP
jgi:nitrite reductase/ring-hydroxylating ferredoxin subunit